MGITTNWENNDIIRFDFPSTGFTWDEFYRLEAEIRAIVEESGRQVGYMFVFPQNARMPDNALSHGKRVVENRHKQIEVIVNVGTNGFLRTLFNMGIRMYPSIRDGVMMAATVEEAREIIRDRLTQTEQG